jgi:hypothetical protein
LDVFLVFVSGVLVLISYQAVNSFLV